jgi:hypothetical protein
MNRQSLHLGATLPRPCQGLEGSRTSNIRPKGGLTLLTRAANRPTSKAGPLSAIGGMPRSLGAQRSSGVEEYCSLHWPSASSGDSKAWPLRVTTLGGLLQRRRGTAACRLAMAASRRVSQASRPVTPAPMAIRLPRAPHARRLATTLAHTDRTEPRHNTGMGTAAAPRVTRTGTGKAPRATPRPRSKPRPNRRRRRDRRESLVRSPRWPKRRWARLRC